MDFTPQGKMGEYVPIFHASRNEKIAVMAKM